MRKIIAGLLMVALVFPLMIAVLSMVSITPLKDIIANSAAPEWLFTIGTSLDSTVVAAGLIALVVTVLIAAQSTHDRLLWLGGALLVPALLMLAMGFSINSDLVTSIIRYGVQQMHYDAFLYGQAVITDAATPILRAVAGSFGNTGLIAASLAVVLFVVSAMLPDGKSEDESNAVSAQ